MHQEHTGRNLTARLTGAQWIARGTRGACGAACLALYAGPLLAQQGARALPPLLPDSQEIRLALSAAPPEISRDADVWVLRRGGHVKVKSGTSGVACLVSRDNPDSLYPICYDAEAARTILWFEMREQQLRERGLDEAAIDSAIAQAVARGELHAPTRPALSWMMSPEQVIYDGAHGRRVGQWHPHIMIYMPYMMQAQLGFKGMSDGDLSLQNEGKATAHLLVLERDWARPAVH